MHRALNRPMKDIPTSGYPEIYRIVSQKALDNGGESQNPISGGVNLEIPSTNGGDKKAGGCC